MPPVQCGTASVQYSEKVSSIQGARASRATSRKLVPCACGSGGALIYVYDPEATSGTGLHTPANPSGAYAAISHVTFCFDYEVQ
ncbi:MAG: hypothetical protein ACO3DJ_07510, partial [Alphaproteobacteria bacterium]